MSVSAIAGVAIEPSTPHHDRSLSRARRLEQRESDVAGREMDVWSREQALAAREDLAQALLTAARERDAAADALDAEADQRERMLDLAHMLSSANDTAYGDDWPTRRHAALDRTRAKADRSSSHQDLTALANHGARPAEDS
jgi:hypothetical protein